jgi:hypothetical protein
VTEWNLCGGGVEYLHRDPASRRRRRKGKSQIWGRKIWSRVPRDSDPRKNALTRANSIYKRETHPLVKEGAPQKQDRNCQTVINYWSTPRLSDWLTVRRNVTLTLTESVQGGSYESVVSWKSESRRIFSYEEYKVLADKKTINFCQITLSDDI